MSNRTATLIGWGLIAAVAAICFVLNQLRAQYIYFNWFIIFTIVASTILVLAHVYLAKRTNNNEDAAGDPNQNPDSIGSERG